MRRTRLNRSMGSNFLKYSLLCAFFCLFLSNHTRSQIPAPDFLCVTNDSLIWSPNVVSCNMLSGYRIYFSTNIDGPYTLLDEIPFPSATFYIHNQNGVFYYYLESIADCPGEPILQSDTLTNDFLPGVDIKRTTIENNAQIRIDWPGLDHPNFAEYVLYKNTPNGTLPIGRTSDTFFYDPFPDLSLVQRYTLTVADGCGNESIFSNFHNTVLIEVENDSCSSEVSVNYTPYSAWEQEGYQVDLISLDHLNSGNDLVVFSGDNTDNVVVDTLLPQNDYCLVLRVRNPRTNFTSESNHFCFYHDYFNLDYLYAYNISYNLNNELSIFWLWNNSARLNSATVQDASNSFQENITVTNPLALDNEQSLGTIENASLFIRAEDVCSNVLTSETLSASSIELAFDEDNFVEVLASGPMLPAASTSVLSSLYLVLPNGTEQFIDDISDFTQPYLYGPVSNNTDSLCFVMKTEHTNNYPELNDNDLISRSKIRCISKNPQLFFPTAFAPDGFNSEFKAQSSNFNLDQYLLRVYNRYGEMVFESTDPREAWDGKWKGRLMPAGLYLYTVEFEKRGNSPVNQRGTVFLLK